MAQAKITKQAVDATHPGPKDKLVWDTKLSGFGLKVTPAGGEGVHLSVPAWWAGREGPSLHHREVWCAYARQGEG